MPLNDPFYRAPENISSYSPGEIINTRSTPGPIGAAQQYTSVAIKASYQLLYATTNAQGNIVPSVCTVIVPENAKHDKVLAYQTAYDSSDPNCSPSYTLQQKSNQTTYDPLFMVAGLNQGWIVTTADYEGLEAQFVNGLMSGYATLDSIRATLASTALTGVLPNATTTLWGYSGGALAAEWALELQPTYAKDLSIAGAAMGGLTPNITNVLHNVNKGMFVYQAFAGINGLSFSYPALAEYVNSVLIPEKAHEFHAINFVCTNDSQAQNREDGQDISTYFKGGFDALNNPVAQDVITNGATMGRRSTPTIPMFVYKAIGDEISHVADTDALVEKYCADGARIEYERNLVGEHVSEAILGSGAAVNFLIDRMDGKPVAAGCKKTDVLVANVKSFRGFSANLLGILNDILLAPLRPTSLQEI